MFETKRKIGIIMLGLILATIVSGSVSAHVPVRAGDNGRLDHAREIKDPAKSWAIYDSVEGRDCAKYYRFPMKEGDRLRIMLFTPDEDFTPGLVLMTPARASNGTPPHGVEIPEGYGYEVVPGKQGEHREYEPFTPSSYYYTVDLDRKVNSTGTYYIAVYGEGEGKVGIALGYEERYGVLEWIQVPFDAVNIHVWEGQSIFFVLAPFYIIVIAGVVKVRLLAEDGDRKPLDWVGTLAGLFYVGSGGIILTQMIIGAASSEPGAGIMVTLVFAALPILLGISMLKMALKKTGKEKIKPFIVGILGIFFWAGYLIGPALALIYGIFMVKTERGGTPDGPGELEAGPGQR